MESTASTSEIPHKRMWESSTQSDMADLLNNFPTEEQSNSVMIANLQAQLDDIRKKLQTAETVKPRKVTLASVDAKIDMIIKILTEDHSS